jgi:hypothetical protein
MNRPRSLKYMTVLTLIVCLMLLCMVATLAYFSHKQVMAEAVKVKPSVEVMTNAELTKYIKNRAGNTVTGYGR